jgi:4-amino-4-deoxy-L-arabinose transferase-like glycosyltransferase
VNLRALALFALLVWLTRAPLAPTHLFYFDSVNYALALEDFNPARHQPQPPGSPFYVYLCRALRLAAGSAEQTFLLSGVLAAAIAMWLLLLVARRVSTPAAGWIAALLLLAHPVLWLATLTNQARAFLAVASAGVALLALRAAARDAPVAWLYAAGLLAGSMGGFRAEAPVLLAPLLVWAAWSRRARWTEWATLAAAAAMPTLLWLGLVMRASGGPQAYFALLDAYSQDQFTASSPLFGASWRQSWRMIEVALVFNFLCAAVWLWALVKRRAPLAGHGLFLAAWFVPAFLFQCVVHVYDPDHALLTVPALCLVGGHVLASAFTGVKARAAAAAAACALSAAIFFHPLRGAARPMSYQVVTRVETAVTEAFAAIREARARGPVTVIVGATLVTWRHVAYYFPEAEIWTRDRWSPSGAAAPSLEAGRSYVLLDRAVTVSQTPPAGFPPAPAASHSAPPASSGPAPPLSDAPR